jgi:hypothetical protein
MRLGISEEFPLSENPPSENMRKTKVNQMENKDQPDEKNEVMDKDKKFDDNCVI